ncbi:hypothetical protein BS50DRAFT_656838 [Corynespora cassiicola Philippines]|uniref:RING-type domain-containing protein n=1 Tax=Corynespora cassiicola Philippines TaxID=1448308 RepID=A0A2T2N2G8_CORCC|nr:hypothetical protein BS50DRAFT_656838 [Corynespora cassiicola Philippines]
MDHQVLLWEHADYREETFNLLSSGFEEFGWKATLYDEYGVEIDNPARGSFRQERLQASDLSRAELEFRMRLRNRIKWWSVTRETHYRSGHMLRLILNLFFSLSGVQGETPNFFLYNDAQDNDIHTFELRIRQRTEEILMTEQDHLLSQLLTLRILSFLGIQIPVDDVRMAENQFYSNRREPSELQRPDGISDVEWQRLRFERRWNMNMLEVLLPLGLDGPWPPELVPPNRPSLFENEFSESSSGGSADESDVFETASEGDDPQADPETNHSEHSSDWTSTFSDRESEPGSEWSDPGPVPDLEWPTAQDLLEQFLGVDGLDFLPNESEPVLRSLDERRDEAVMRINIGGDVDDDLIWENEDEILETERCVRTVRILSTFWYDHVNNVLEIKEAEEGGFLPNTLSGSEADSEVDSKENVGCSICYDEKHVSFFVQLACEHVWCGACVVRGFNALLDTSHHSATIRPPSCCGSFIPLSDKVRKLCSQALFSVRGYLFPDNMALQKRYEDQLKRRAREALTMNRLICHGCHEWVEDTGGNFNHESQKATCQMDGCQVATCLTCKTVAHEGITCPRDVQEFDKILEKNGIKKCIFCSAPIQHNGGCNEMDCSNCGSTFCFRCHGTWRFSCDLHRFERPSLGNNISGDENEPEKETDEIDPSDCPHPDWIYSARGHEIRRNPHPRQRCVKCHVEFLWFRECTGCGMDAICETCWPNFS